MSGTAQAAIAVLGFFFAVVVLTAVARTFHLAIAGLVGVLLLACLLALGIAVNNDV